MSLPEHRSDLALFLVHRRDLITYASRIVGNMSLAEDVVQEAFVRFSAASHQILEEPVGYVYRIVRNLAIDMRRRSSREQRVMVSVDASESLMIAADQPSPEAEASARAEIRAMEAAMAELPERTRIALEMSRFGGCKLKQIAKHLDISIGLAHALVIDGLEHCRARLCRPPAERKL